MNQYIRIGLDVHVESITAAIREEDRPSAEVIKLSGDLMKVRRLFRRLSKRGAIRACYEASGAGFVLHRVLTRDGFHCQVIAPLLIPRKPGDRRKTDRIDAVMLARLYRTGHLTPIPSAGSSGSACPTRNNASPPSDASTACFSIAAWSIEMADRYGPKNIESGWPNCGNSFRGLCTPLWLPSWITWSIWRCSGTVWMPRLSVMPGRRPSGQGLKLSVVSGESSP